jgi:hypothetical protein
MAAPRLEFSVPEDAVDDAGRTCVVPQGDRTFALYEQDGCYRLPIVMLAAGTASAHGYVSVQVPARLTLRPGEGEVLPDLFGRALSQSWVPPGRATVPLTGNQIVSTGAAVEGIHLGSARTPP